MVDSWFYIQIAETISPYPQKKKRKGSGGNMVNDFVSELLSATEIRSNELAPTTIETVKSGPTNERTKIRAPPQNIIFPLTRVSTTSLTKTSETVLFFNSEISLPLDTLSGQN